jgi:hypothetical protein
MKRVTRRGFSAWPSRARRTDKCGRRINGYTQVISTALTACPLGAKEAANAMAHLPRSRDVRSTRALLGRRSDIVSGQRLAIEIIMPKSK